MRILFMGSPELAIPSFKAVQDLGHVIGAVTQPPKASGRGRKLTSSPIQVEAEKAGIQVLVPSTLRTEEAQDTLRRLQPDIAVVVAYGKILPPEVLEIPVLGCVNVHASILPKLRGAAPIQWAIARGYTETGVTLMQMDEGMDTGPILLQKRTGIGDQETAGALGVRLARMGSDILLEGLPRLARGELAAVKQDDSLATYAPLLTKKDGLLDWKAGATELADRVRGFSPWPGTHTTRSGSRLLITRALAQEATERALPGTVLSVRTDGIRVACGSGTLCILAVKPEGKREMTVQEFLSGHKVEIGEILGDQGAANRE